MSGPRVTDAQPFSAPGPVALPIGRQPSPEAAPSMRGGIACENRQHTRRGADQGPLQRPRQLQAVDRLAIRNSVEVLLDRRHENLPVSRDASEQGHAGVEFQIVG